MRYEVAAITMALLLVSNVVALRNITEPERRRTPRRFAIGAMCFFFIASAVGSFVDG